MVEVFPNLFVGTQYEFEEISCWLPEWAFVHACKEPYHRAFVGYHAQGAPKGHPEYLISQRGNRLALNLVDAADPKFIPLAVIDAALDFIDQNIENKKVFCHCNMGLSRSPSLVFYFLHKRRGMFNGPVMAEIEEFKKIYPNFSPGAGMLGFLEANW